MAKENIDGIYRIGACVNIGTDRENQEDFISFKQLDEDNLLVTIADGSGSLKDQLQPGAIVTSSIEGTVERLFNDDKDLFLRNPNLFIKNAFINAGEVLGALKIANEERYSGYGASVTTCLFSGKDRIYIVHAGNTRLYVLRNGQAIQMTHDHTRAFKLLKEEKIDSETYYIHPDRLRLTSGLGIVYEPEIETLSGKIKDTDIVIMTTDGVHYAIRPEAISEIVLRSSECEEAAAALIGAANSQKYPDNCSAIVIRKRNLKEE